MAEPRRVELKTISATNGEKKEKKRPLTQRFTLALGESTASTCPEFSFGELVKKEKKSHGSIPAIDPNDPFGDEDDQDEVAAIARKFEEKYGPKPKKKLKCLEDDYYDLGEGYDENDPFIDNTEAYDEVVPSCLTTQHGGFYINRGTLDFRTLSDQDDSAGEFTPTVRKRGRPRKILDSESEHEEGGEPKKKKMKKKKLKEGIDVEKKKKKKLSVGPDGEKIIKRRKPLDPDKKKKTSPTVAELLKQQTASTAATPNGALEDLQPGAPCAVADQVADKSTVQDKIEAVIFEQLQDSMMEDRKVNGGEGGGPNNLPSDLPLELARNIDSIKQAAKDTTEGKCKFFSGNVNKMLLDIELGSRQLACGKRTSIFAHLADHLPCGKETLVKRAKKLRENQQDDQLKGPIQRLKDAINEVMPVLQEQHEQEVLKYRMENREKMEDGGEGQKEEGANTESDEEEKLAGTGTSDGQSRKGNRGPRKKFKWTPEIKKLLCQIVSVKMHMFDTYRIRNQTAEEYLKTFLDNEVKPLWPQGWIQTRMLFKESRSVHGSWTNPQKPKKTMLVTKSAASPQSHMPVSVSPENVLDHRQAKTNTSSISIVDEVIELSNDDDQQMVPAVQKDTKANAASMTLALADEPRLPPVDILNISPNSVAAMAAAAAASAAAAVSTPKTQPSSGVADAHQRENLVTGILKGTKPGSLGLPSAGKTLTVHNAPTTPPTPQTPQGKETVFSPFLAEFDRYLNNRHNVATTSSAGPSSSSRQQAAQLQSKTVSSSTAGEGKYKQSAQIKWQIDGLLGEEKVRKSPAGSQGVGPAVGLLPASGSVTSDNLPAQQAHYKKMYSLLSEPATASQKSKGEKVRDEILGRIQAEMDASSAKSTASRLAFEDSVKKAMLGVGSASQHSKQHAGYSPSGRQAHAAVSSSNRTGINQRHSPSGVIPPAHQPPSSYSQAAAGSVRQMSSSGSSGSERGSKPSSVSAHSPQQHSPLQASPPSARSGMSTSRPSGRESPHRKPPARSSPTSAHLTAAFQRSTSGQAAASKLPATPSGKMAGQGNPSQQIPAFARQPAHTQAPRPSSSSLSQTQHAQKSPLSGQATAHSVDGSRKFPTAAQSSSSWSEKKKLPAGGGGAGGNSGGSGSSGTQRVVEQTLFDQIESHLKQQAAMEQKALQNLALAGLLPQDRSGLSGAWSSHGLPGRLSGSLSQSSMSEGDPLGSGRSVGGSPLPAHSSPVTLSSQGQTSPRQAAGPYNPRQGALPTYPQHSHPGSLHKDGSKGPHGY